MVPEHEVPELRKFVAPEFLFGDGSLRLVGQYAANLGMTNVLLVTDAGVREAGWAGAAQDILLESGIETTLFDKVTPNPRVDEVIRGADEYLAAHCDGIVAVGGGSPMDCAKGIGVVAVNRGHILDYEGVDRITKPMPPMICVPTTGGTSSDVSQFAIFSHLQERRKIAVVSKAVVPDVALIDPETLSTLSPYIIACTGMDALVHAVEAFVSTGSSPITDVHARTAIQLVIKHLRRLVADPHDADARRQIMLGSLEAGLAFSNASLGAVHALAHSVGGAFDLPHGECNALLLEHVLDYNFAAAAERYEALLPDFGIEAAALSSAEAKRRLAEEIHQLRLDLGIGGGFAARGISRDDLSEMARVASADPCLVTNPRPAKARDLQVIYEESL